MVRTPIRLMTAVSAVALLVLAACGDDDNDTTAASGTRTIEIEMRDIEFSPEVVQVEPGETVRFVFHNKGAVVHDAFFGDEDAQDDHEMEMRDADEIAATSGMEHESGAEEAVGGGISVEPGESGELTHTFRAGDELLIACHQAGHYEAGMKVIVNVG